ncbi:MAG: TlpA disulfide reductase family protein [Bdellovibrionota bacterium]
MSLRRVCLSLVALLPVSSCVSVKTDSAVQSSPIRSAAPEFDLPDAFGTQYRLADYRGKVVLLNFWAPWCFSCESEMSAFEDLRSYFPESNFEVLAVTVLDDDKRVQSPIKHHFPVLFDANRTVAGRYGVTTIPVTLILDKQGRIVSFPDPDGSGDRTVFEGPRGWSSLKVVREIQKLIDE